MAQYKASRLALGGGCALNLHTNSEVRRLLDPYVGIPPACNDSGQALGAALFVSHCLRRDPVRQVQPWINGCGISPDDARRAIGSAGLNAQPFNSHLVAKLLAEGGSSRLPIRNQRLGREA